MFISLWQEKGLNKKKDDEVRKVIRDVNEIKEMFEIKDLLKKVIDGR